MININAIIDDRNRDILWSLRYFPCPHCPYILVRKPEVLAGVVQVPLFMKKLIIRWECLLCLGNKIWLGKFGEIRLLISVSRCNGILRVLNPQQILVRNKTVLLDNLNPVFFVQFIDILLRYTAFKPHRYFIRCHQTQTRMRLAVNRADELDITVSFQIIQWTLHIS